jgi:hypothetical protein
VKGEKHVADERRSDDASPIEGVVLAADEARDELQYGEDVLDEDEDWDEPPFAIGGSVVVKPDEIDPGSDQPIGGWQGRVMGYHEEDPLLVDVAWDSVTLRGMSMEWMAQSDLEGLDWSRMYLLFDTLDPATPRDTEEEANETHRELQSRVVAELNVTGKLYVLASGKAVLELVHAQPNPDERAAHAAWHTYLQQALKLPFIAEVAVRDQPPLHQGERVTVRAVTGLDEQEGTMVRVQRRRDGVEVPLIALKIGTPSAANYQVLSDYTEWLQDQKDMNAPIMLPRSAFLHL